MSQMFPETRPEIFPGSALINTVRMRQIRVKDFGLQECFIPPMLRKSFKDPTCYPEWKTSSMDTRTQMKSINMTNTLGNDVVNSMNPYFKQNLEKAFQYDEESYRIVTTYEAWKNSYPGSGGYIMDFNSTTSQTDVVAMVNHLQKLQWIDGGTRGIFIEFALYNKQSSIFVNVRLLFEFYATGGCGTYPTIEVAKINQFGTPEQQSKLNTFLYIYIYTFFISTCMVYIYLYLTIYIISYIIIIHNAYIYIYQQVTL